MVRCQFALYPLRVEEVDEEVKVALDVVRAQGMEVVVGRMSSEIRGGSEQVFAALQAAFDHAADTREVVMTVTLSNAC